VRFGACEGEKPLGSVRKGYGTYLGRVEMIIRKGQTPVIHADEEDARYYGPSELLPLADVGGLTQFGAHLHTLQPGTRSSDRHWHEAQDEFLYVISGEATVIEEDGPHLLQPGDAACWPAGAENAHHVVNRSESPCSFLIFGTRVLPDVIHYPDQGEILYDFEDGSSRRERNDGTLIEELRTFEDGSWQLQRADGTLIKEGKAEPGH
jgi:uncharacterized cupin superfamily protein